MKKILVLALIAMTVLMQTASAVNAKGPFIYVENEVIRVVYDENSSQAGNQFDYQLIDQQYKIVLTGKRKGSTWYPDWKQSGVYKVRVYYKDSRGSTQFEDSEWTNIFLRSSDPNQPYDMGIPNLNGKTHGKDAMNMAILWVQIQMKATGVYYQGDVWDETGNLGSHTMEEIASFMKARGYSGHSGRVDQQVVNELAAYLGSRLVPVYVGGYYDHMNTIMTGGSTGSMNKIVSNLIDIVPHVTTGARWVQCCLSKLGYYQGPIDGKYGEGTENAVMRFQRDYHFQERNYVTLGVARAMLEACYQRGYSLNDLP